MPLLYGEADRAFIRLQEEIIKENDDQSVFAWEYNDKLPYIEIPHDHSYATLGVLAPHPSYFASCGTIINSLDREHWDSHTMTNRGLKMQLPIIRQGPDQFSGVLSCAHNSEDEVWGSIVSYICIPLCPSAKGDSSLGRDPKRGLQVIRESAIENADFLSVYLLKSMYALPSRGLRLNTIEIPPATKYRGFHLSQAMYAAKPVSLLSTFRSFGETSYRSLSLPPIASDFIVALRFISSTSFGSGFTIVLESRRGCDSWGVIAVPTSRDDVLETIIRQNIGRLPSTFEGFLTTDLRVQLNINVERTPAEPPELRVDLDIDVQDYGLLEAAPLETVFELDIDHPTSPVRPSNPVGEPTDNVVHVVEGTFELE
jgi:hypothetical protein